MMQNFAADLHVHTRFSYDSLSSPEDVLSSAARLSLSAVAITDHNEIAGALEAKRIAAEKGLRLQVIVGEEVATDKGDLLCYFLNERILPGKLERVITEVKDQGGICCAAHPFDFARHGIALRALAPRTLDRIDAIEAFNARVSLASQNRDALLFSMEREKPTFAGSDAHHASEVGAAYVEFSGVKRLDAKNILGAPRKIGGARSSRLVHLYSRYAVARKGISRLLPKRLK
jgi:predicted metal-dependent phosphoesterase TrpH